MAPNRTDAYELTATADGRWPLRLATVATVGRPTHSAARHAATAEESAP